MKHARADYDTIQDTSAARELAALILSMDLVTTKGVQARKIAREILGIDDATSTPDLAIITTNGTTRLIPRDEPVFLLRGQDANAPSLVRQWARMAYESGAKEDIVKLALDHAAEMEAWPIKKVSDIPAEKN